MIYDMKAIPTDYGGVTFRSRLEAKWAAFFDLCKWQWEYEPLDMSGWAPDFAIKKRTGGRVLVEVKPFEFRHWAEAKGQHRPVQSAYSKCLPHVQQVGPTEIEYNSVLLLGTSPFYHGSMGFVGMWARGWMDEVSFFSAVLAHTDGRADLAPVDMKGTLSRKWESTTSGGHTCFCEMPEPSLIAPSQIWHLHTKQMVESRWREASNLTQWKK